MCPQKGAYVNGKSLFTVIGLLVIHLMALIHIGFARLQLLYETTSKSIPCDVTYYYYYVLPLRHFVVCIGFT